MENQTNLKLIIEICKHVICPSYNYHKSFQFIFNVIAFLSNAVHLCLFKT